MMKRYSYTLLIAAYCYGCATSRNIPLPDLDKTGRICDSLISAGLYAKAANLYFTTGQNIKSSELYVYAAWQYGEAKLNDSALLAINYAIDHGMSNPYVLETYHLTNCISNSPISKVVEHKLDSIKTKLSRIDNFDIITDPVDSFWPYFKSALSDTNSARKYLEEYIRKGSFATKDYYHKRYENIENMYRQMIQRTPEHYKYTHQFLSRDKLDTLKIAMIQMMHRLSEMYSRAVFPKVYLVPGILTSNGTQTEIGLFVAAEMFVKSEKMPTESLSEWQYGEIAPPKNMIFVTIHELMHFQQAYKDEKNANNLLGKVITEGVCDFLVELLSNDINTLDPARVEKIAYLSDPKNMEFILAEFKEGMYAKDLSKWMYNGGAIKDRPSDLGYTLGYKICKSFYDRSQNKTAAITELLTTDNFEKILHGSEYADLL